MWSALTALLPGKAASTALSPRKEAIYHLRQVTAQLLPRQAGRQLPSPGQCCFPRSQHSLPNSTPSREGSINGAIPWEGSNYPSSNSGNTRSQAVRCSTRLRASQADSTIPQVDSKVSQVSRASTANSTASQATGSAGSQEARAISPANSNNKQAGNSSGRGNRCLAILRASPGFPRRQHHFPGK